MANLQDEIKSLVSSLGIAKLRASSFVIGDDIGNEESRSAGGEPGQKEHSKKNKGKKKGKGKPDQQDPAPAPVTMSKSLLKKTNKGQRPDKLGDRPVKAPVDNKLTSQTQDVKESAGRKRRKGRRGKSGDDGSAVQVDEVSSSGDGQDGVVAADESTAAAPPTLWYTLSVTAAECSRVSGSECSRLKEEADLMLGQDAAAYKRDGGGRAGSQWHWMQTVLTSGTIADKLAVRRTLLREAPAAHLHALEDTVRMVAARGKSHSMMAMGRLVEMFSKLLLPPGRTLKPFFQQPIAQLDQIAAGDPAIRRRQLVLWLFEDRLKVIYHDFVGKVREMAHDTVEKTRKHAVSAMTQLLISHPELEQTLLENLVNKLGDEKKAVGCLTVRKLSSLLRSHPAMRTVVVKEVERILFRPNVNKRVQFYGICFLSQVPFSSEGDEALAQRVIKVYIGFFKAGVKQAELDSRLMRALLGGLTSCVDSCGQLAAEQLQQYVEPLQHIAQLAGSFGVAVQALLLMFRLTSAGNTQPSDRFYSALYKKLVHPGMSGSPKVADFLNLVYRALTLDTCEPRVRAFVKRLLQYCQHQTVELTCSVLVLIGELFRCRPELHRIESGSQQNSSRSCWTADDDTDDDEERPRDVLLPEDDEAGQYEEEEAGSDKVRGAGPGWTFTSSSSCGGSDSAPHGYRLSVYTPLHRDPRWCRAELAPLHELCTLRRHYHPSAALFADQLLAPASSAAAAAVQPSKPPYAGNPLQDFRLMHFLNRFCYRNPKKLSTAAADGPPAAAKSLTVSSAAYARLSESQVPGDELFFHRFFHRRLQQVKDLEESAEVDVTDDAGDITDQAFDNLMQQWYGGSGKKKGKDKAASAEALDFASELASKAVDPREDDSGGSSAEEREDVSAPPAGLMVDDSDASDDGVDDDEMDGLFCDADDDDNAEESDINDDDDAVPGKRRKGGAPANTKRRKMSLSLDLAVPGDEFPVLPDRSESGNPRQSTSRAELRQLDWEEGKTRKPGRLTKRQDYRANSRSGRRRPRTAKNAAGFRKH